MQTETEVAAVFFIFIGNKHYQHVLFSSYAVNHYMWENI